MNKIVLASVAASVPTVAPAIANERQSENIVLIDLGQQFDDALARLKEAYASLNAVKGDFHRQVARGQRWPKERDWTLADGARCLRREAKIKKTTEIGKKFVAACEASDAAFKPIGALTRAIQAEPATSIVGLGVKAKFAALACCHYWDKPVDDLDWDQKATRSLIEETFKAAGLPDVQDYLGEDLSPRRPADAELLELGIEYEDLLVRELMLRAEHDRLRDLSIRQGYEKCGIDPDDKKACDAPFRRTEIFEAKQQASRENGHNRAFKKFDRAWLNTARVGKKILACRPTTMSGLMVLLRVMETHEELLKQLEPAEAIMAEIREFARNHA